MPPKGTRLQWEWKLSPQTVISAVNLLVISIGVIGLFYKMQSDLLAQKESVERLDKVIQAMTLKQSELSERAIKTETKVDIILPVVQRIEQSLRSNNDPVRR